MESRRSLKGWLLALLLLAPALAAAVPAQSPTGSEGAPAEPLAFGVFPVVSAVALFKRFAPLAEYLSQGLGRALVMETAKDFPTFFARTAERRYDVVVTAPHFTLAAADSGRYRVVARVSSELVGLVVVPEDSPARSLADLAGKTIATPPASALITKAGIEFLSDSGLNGERAPRYEAYNSHNAAYEAALGGLADAAVCSNNAVGAALERGLPLRVIAQAPALPNQAVLVAADLPPEIGDRLQGLLVSMTESEQGRAVLSRLEFDGYRPASAEDYEILRPYLAPR